MKQFKVLIRFTLIYTCFILFSCKSQVENDIDIKGNWQIISNTLLNDEIIYTEYYINDEYIAKYTDKIGLHPVNKYEVKKNKLILLSWSEDEKYNIGTVSITKNIMKIKKEGYEVVYRKYSEKPNLEDYKKGRVNVEDFAHAFYKRRKKWKD